MSAKDKRAVSLMISYVLLISMVVTLGIIVASWIYFQAKNPPVGSESCDGVSITGENFCCYVTSTGKALLNMSLNNNGRFTVREVFVRYETPLGSGDVFRYSFPKFISPLVPNNKTNFSIAYLDSSGNPEFRHKRIDRLRLVPYTGVLCSENGVTFDLPNDCRNDYDDLPRDCTY